MKKFILSLFLLGMSLLAMADIPAGKVIYLDVSQCPDWQGAPCYLLHLSRTGMTHVMQAVPGKPNMYMFTTIVSTQDNLNFGLGKTVVTQDFSGWFGNYVSKNIEQTGWSESTPIFVVECPGSQLKGHWESLPANDTVESVSYEIADQSCVDSTYVVSLTVTLSGPTATLRISGDLLATDRVIPKCSTPYTTTIRAKCVHGGGTHTLTFKACSDAAGTSVNNTKTLDIVQPDLECEKTVETVEVCNTESTVTLQTNLTGDSIQWLDANGNPVGTGTQVTVTTPAADATYTAKVFQSYINPDNNLMVNGDFENGYNGFQSDYEPISDKSTHQPVLNPTWIYSNKYDNGDQYGRYYCITNNAYDLQESGIFAPIKAHGGEEFLVVDATDQGYAWYTNTAQSPQLVLTAGQTYLFSYWVACPNTGAQLQDPKAQLQFVIELHMTDGTTKKANLTNVYTVGMETPVNDWYYQEVRWSCPYNCNDVTIGVKDLTQSAGGNDFCLDDIIFQPITESSKRLAMTEYHPVIVKNCGEPDPQPDPETCADVVMAKWDDVLFVNNGATGLNGKAVGYQWYKDGMPISGATSQSYYEPGGSMATGLYMAMVILSDGTVVFSCPKQFAEVEHSVESNSAPFPVVNVSVLPVIGALYVVKTEYEDGSVEMRKIIKL